MKQIPHRSKPLKSICNFDNITKEQVQGSKAGSQSSERRKLGRVAFIITNENICPAIIYVRLSEVLNTCETP